VKLRTGDKIAMDNGGDFILKKFTEKI